MLAKVSRNVSEYRGVFICWHNKEETEGSVYCDTRQDAQKFVVNFFEENLRMGHGFSCAELNRTYNIKVENWDDKNRGRTMVKVFYDN